MKLLSRLSLKLWAIAANSGAALSSFVLGLLVLHGSTTAEYGAFAFLLVLQWLGCGLINALCGAPLLIGYRDYQLTPAQIRPFFWLAVAVVALIALLQALVLLLLGFSVTTMLIYTVAVGCQLLRWYARCYLQNTDPARVLSADAIFTFVILPLSGLTLMWSRQDIQSAGLVLMVGALTALWPVRQFLCSQLQRNIQVDFFRNSLQQQAKPALVGVITVEATANIHSYLIMFALGPAALAPVAAAALFLRPMTLIQTSLAQIERPLLAKAVACADAFAIARMLTPFYRYSIYAFIVNLTGFMLLAWVTPHWLWPESTQLAFFVQVSLFVLATNLLRSARLPASTLLQCFDEFNFLARVTLVSGLVTVPLVALLLNWYGVFGALTAMLLGELLIAVPIMLKSRHCLLALRLRQQSQLQPYE